MVFFICLAATGYRLYVGRRAGQIMHNYRDFQYQFQDKPKIHCKEKACFVLKHRVDAHDKIPTVIILVRQMPVNYIDHSLWFHKNRSLKLPEITAFSLALSACQSR